MKKRHIVVTGGAGYVGSTLVLNLLASGYKVTVIDNLTFGAESLMSVWYHPQFTFVHADVTDARALSFACSAVQGVYGVVHLAAIVGDPACAKDPERAKLVNWNGAVNVFDFAEEKKAERFIFASTCSNYGKMADANEYVTERTPLAPVSLYAELKVKFEGYLNKRKAAGTEVAVTALRFSTVYGLSPRMRFDLTVNEFTRDLALGRTLEVFGEQFWRPYCHVHDFARAMMLVLESERKRIDGEVFNVGATDENYTKKDIVECVLGELPGADVRYVRKEEDPRDYRVSFSKIQEQLGFRVSKTVPEGVREIRECIHAGAFSNPDDTKYSNI